jgi:hypothetical protein
MGLVIQKQFQTSWRHSFCQSLREEGVMLPEVGREPSSLSATSLVRRADHVAIEVVAEEFGIATDDSLGHGIPDIGMELMPVQSEELPAAAI